MTDFRENIKLFLKTTKDIESYNANKNKDDVEDFIYKLLDFNYNEDNLKKREIMHEEGLNYYPYHGYLYRGMAVSNIKLVENRKIVSWSSTLESVYVFMECMSEQYWRDNPYLLIYRTEAETAFDFGRILIDILSVSDSEKLISKIEEYLSEDEIWYKFDTGKVEIVDKRIIKPENLEPYMFSSDENRIREIRLKEVHLW